MLSKLAALALAALFAFALPHYADARSPNSQGGGRDVEAPAPQPEPAAPAAPAPSAPDAPSGPSSAGDGSGSDARAHFRLFCDRWPLDYWCQPGPPYVGVPK